MAELVKRTPDKVIVRPKAEWNHRGKVLQAAGVAVAVATTPLGIWVSSQFLVVGIAAAVLVIVALPMVLVGRRTVLDMKERNVLLATGDIMPFDQVADIDLRSYVQEVSRQQGTVQSLRFRVALVHKGADPEHTEHVDRARKQIEEVVGRPDARLNTGEHKLLTEEMSEADSQVPIGEPVVFADHADELKIWRVAERVAKALDVPIADHCGDRLVIRTPAELDLPFGERAARIGGHIDDPGEAPEDLRDSSTAEAVRFSWRWPVMAPFITLTAVGVVLSLLGFLIWDDMPEIRIAFGGAGVLCLLAAGLVFDGRRRSVEVAHGAVSFRAGVWLRPRRRIALDRLEMVRVSKALDPSLSLISDERIVRCRLPSARAADWARLRLERFLVDQARSPST